MHVKLQSTMTINPNKKSCVNNPAYTYSGKESSPLGLGYTAEAEQVGTTKKGRDESMWMVGIKNGVKVWNRIPTFGDASSTPSSSATPTPKKATKKKTEAEIEAVETPKKAVAKKKVVEDDTEKKVDAKKVIEDDAETPKKKVVAKKKTVEDNVEAPKKKAVAKKKVIEDAPSKEEPVTPKKKIVRKKVDA